MNASEFLNLAIRLSAAPGEAELRSSVSRAYYGAFHEAKALVESCGVVLPNTAEAHAKVNMCLNNAGSRDAETAAALLNSLRSERNDADYDLSATKFRSRITAQLQIANARAISDALQACTSAELRSHIHAYARDVLRLQVTSE